MIIILSVTYVDCNLAKYDHEDKASSLFCNSELKRASHKTDGIAVALETGEIVWPLVRLWTSLHPDWLQVRQDDPVSKEISKSMTKHKDNYDPMWTDSKIKSFEKSTTYFISIQWRPLSTNQLLAAFPAWMLFEYYMDWKVAIPSYNLSGATAAQKRCLY